MNQETKYIYLVLAGEHIQQGVWLVLSEIAA